MPSRSRPLKSMRSMTVATTGSGARLKCDLEAAVHLLGDMEKRLTPFELQFPYLQNGDRL